MYKLENAIGQVWDLLSDIEREFKMYKPTKPTHEDFIVKNIEQQEKNLHELIKTKTYRLSIEVDKFCDFVYFIHNNTKLVGEELVYECEKLWVLLRKDIFEDKFIELDAQKMKMNEFELSKFEQVKELLGVI